MSAHRIVADFLTARNPIENYLQLGLPLTLLHVNSIFRTLEGLETFLGIWKEKHGGVEPIRVIDAIEKLTSKVRNERKIEVCPVAQASPKPEPPLSEDQPRRCSRSFLWLAPRQLTNPLSKLYLYEVRYLCRAIH